MSTATTHPGGRALVGALWALGIAAGLLAPGGGLVMAIAAVCTTYRHSSRLTKAVIIALGLLTVLIQFGAFIEVGRGHNSTSGVV